MGWSSAHLIRVLENAVPGFRKRDNAQRLLLRDFKGVVSDQRLACERANVLLHSFAIPVVGVLRQVRHRDDAELADFCQGVHLGIAEEIGAIPDVIGARRIAAFVAGRMLLAGFGAIAAARGFRRRTPALSVYRKKPVCADGQADAETRRAHRRRLAGRS